MDGREEFDSNGFNWGFGSGYNLEFNYFDNEEVPNYTNNFFFDNQTTAGTESLTNIDSVNSTTSKSASLTSHDAGLDFSSQLAEKYAQVKKDLEKMKQNPPQGCAEYLKTEQGMIMLWYSRETFNRLDINDLSEETKIKIRSMNKKAGNHEKKKDTSDDFEKNFFMQEIYRVYNKYGTAPEMRPYIGHIRGALLSCGCKRTDATNHALAGFIVGLGIPLTRYVMRNKAALIGILALLAPYITRKDGQPFPG